MATTKRKAKQNNHRDNGIADLTPHKDSWQKQRKAIFIEPVSPFNKEESRLWYIMSWALALVFGVAMPHEKRRIE